MTDPAGVLSDAAARLRPAERLADLRRRMRQLLPTAYDIRSMGRAPGRDLIAGITVAIVALPLALAFGITSGLGATAGLTTAIVAGTLAALFGGSHLQVSGPTGAMTVVLVPIVAQFGTDAVLIVGLLAGIILIALAFAGAGRTMRYIPVPVVEGFTIGIAIIIALQQVPTALGVAAEGDRVVATAVAAVLSWIATPHGSEPAITIGIAVTMLVGARLRPGIPISLPAVVVATAAIVAADIDVATIGSIAAGLAVPGLPLGALDHLDRLVLPAVAVAALAALESLLSATVADGMTIGERHDPDRELFGQGLANLVVPFFGGVPATAAIARTAVNVRTGAVSRLAAVSHGVALLLVVVVAAPLVGRIPLAALAGVLIATAIQMVEVSSLTAILRSTRGDAVVLVLTAIATIALDLVTAVMLGLVVAGAFAISQMAKIARLDEIAFDDVRHDDHTAEQRALLDEHIVAYRLDGPLFFGAAHAFLLELSEVSDVRVVVLRLSRIATLDATGASVLADTITRLEHRHVTVLLSGVRQEHESILTRLGVYAGLSSEHHVFDTTPEAIAHAREHVARAVHGPGDA